VAVGAVGVRRRERVAVASGYLAERETVGGSCRSVFRRAALERPRRKWRRLVGAWDGLSRRVCPQQRGGGPARDAARDAARATRDFAAYTADISRNVIAHAIETYPVEQP